MRPGGTVRVAVSPRRFPVGTTVVEAPVFTASGHLVGHRTDRIVLYDSRLDEEHQRALEEAQRISRMLCLDLEVVPSTRWGLFGRILASLGLGGLGRPTIMVSPSDWTSGGGIPQPGAQAC